jgi:hypothetical protein
MGVTELMRGVSDSVLWPVLVSGPLVPVTVMLPAGPIVSVLTDKLRVL